MFGVALPLSWIIYQFVEKPIRNHGKQEVKKPNNKHVANKRALSMTAVLLFLAITGALLAKSQGWPERYELINPYSKIVLEDLSLIHI